MNEIEYHIRRLARRDDCLAWAAATRPGIRILDLPGSRIRVRVAGRGERTSMFACDMPNVVESYERSSACSVRRSNRRYAVGRTTVMGVDGAAHRAAHASSRDLPSTGAPRTLRTDQRAPVRRARALALASRSAFQNYYDHTGPCRASRSRRSCSGRAPTAGRPDITLSSRTQRRSERPASSCAERAPRRRAPLKVAVVAFEDCMTSAVYGMLDAFHLATVSVHRRSPRIKATRRCFASTNGSSRTTRAGSR